MSARGSIGSLRACSGAMYCGVPSSRDVASPASAAIPKSVSLTSPDHDSSTLRGVTSRWTMPSATPSGLLRWCA